MNGLFVNVMDQKYNLYVYPNPATEYIEISHFSKEKIKYISIFTLNGQKVINSSSSRLNVKELNSGYYFIKATLQNGESHYLKFIKQ